VSTAVAGTGVGAKAELGDGSVELAEPVVGIAQGPGALESIGFHAEFLFLQGLLGTIHRHEDVGAEVVGLGIVGIEGDGALGFGIGVSAIPVYVEIKSSQGIVGLGKELVELDRFVGRCFPLGSRLLGIESSADGAQSVVVGETAPGGGIVGLKLNRLLEVLQAGSIVIAEPVVAAVQVGIMCFGIDVPLRGGTGDRDPNFFGDGFATAPTAGRRLC
jgi:hypothetical protein